MNAVLDASALLAYLKDEPGGEIVEEVFEESAISAVNWSEVFQKALAHNIETARLREDLEALGLNIMPFTSAQAEAAASFWPQVYHAGLSLGDRACLALGAEQQIPILTTERGWLELDLPLTIRKIR